MAADERLGELSHEWMVRSSQHEYSYHFTWMGRPIIQLPQDIVAMQEILWRVRPELVIETGIARGGSLVFHASILELIGGEGRVLGIDVDLRDHTRRALEEHPMAKRIDVLDGSSIDEALVEQVRERARGRSPVLVILDSNHTHEHVARELELYAPLVTEGSYCVVFDTIVETMPADFYPNRPWGPGDNPWTAVQAFLADHPEWVVDQPFENRLLLTMAPGGYLRRVGRNGESG
ncbi:MAG: cephalosporin hydroxylase family protein [Myxococcota bacterium]